MKAIILIFIISISFIFCSAQNVIDSSDMSILKSTSMTRGDIEKLIVQKNDSSLYLYGNIRKDYRTFGYEKPNVNSKKLILFSVFTNYVKNNPFGCSLGSYYQTSDMHIELKFISIVGTFMKTIAIKDGLQIAQSIS